MAKVEGLARLKRRLTQLPAKIRAEVKVALDQSAEELMAFQKRFVPVDDGDLRDSIRAEPGRHELSIDVKAGSDKVPHAAWVEFGTVKMTARPYFFPPYRALRRRIKSRTARAVRKAVKAHV